MRIFISGHYTKGDVARNVATAVKYSNIIFNMGHYPYCPHLTHFWHLIYSHDWDEWLKLDLVWLSQCDAYFRIPHSEDSKGANIEQKEAERLGLKIFNSIEQIKTFDK